MNHSGCAQFISKLWTSRSYKPGNDKYVIVPAGMGVMSLSGRLTSHYVPLAQDMIEWLIDHDVMVQQLAINARNFVYI